MGCCTSVQKVCIHLPRESTTFVLTKTLDYVGGTFQNNYPPSVICIGGSNSDFKSIACILFVESSTFSSEYLFFLPQEWDLSSTPPTDFSKFSVQFQLIPSHWLHFSSFFMRHRVIGIPNSLTWYYSWLHYLQKSIQIQHKQSAAFY